MDRLRNSILIVDDDDTSIASLKQILSSEYNVHIALSGQKAVEMAEMYLPDVILLDILMPDMDGYEVFSSLKSSKKTKKIPVIFFTALGAVEHEEKALILGAADYITKPFSQTVVKHRIRNQIKLLDRVHELENTSKHSAIIVKEIEYRGTANPAAGNENLKAVALPVSSARISEDDNLKNKLQVIFAKNNQTLYSEITGAIAANDIKLAHRLVHSLKGNAGQIGETSLQNAAEAVESMLKSGVTAGLDNSMNCLESELMLVLKKLKSLPDPQELQENRLVLSPEQVLTLFEKLEPMLKSGNTKCMRFLDDIRAAPGAEELAMQIERIEFRAASQTLELLKNKWRLEYYG
ncbi:MAG: response regulator [Spirochaetes bacterium]|nr:response regulator [Spirochaetota bacterium]